MKFGGVDILQKIGLWQASERVEEWCVQGGTGAHTDSQGAHLVHNDLDDPVLIFSRLSLAAIV
jgi:hypothetical protein